jgi:hypothetical protein
MLLMLARFNEFLTEYAQKVTEKEKRSFFIIIYCRGGKWCGNI